MTQYRIIGETEEGVPWASEPSPSREGQLRLADCSRTPNLMDLGIIPLYVERREVGPWQSL